MSTSYQPPSTELSTRICSELRRLCVPGYLRGSAYLVYMLGRAIHDPDQLHLISKNLYPDTGRHFCVSAGSVERNARTAISKGWMRGGRSVLEDMACCPLVKRPTVSEFLDIVADYIRRTI